jgi:hypothetical protein
MNKLELLRAKIKSLSIPMLKEVLEKIDKLHTESGDIIFEEGLKILEEKMLEYQSKKDFINFCNKLS